MTAFYIGQHEIDDEAALSTTSSRQCRLSKSTADVISPKPAHMNANEGQRPSRVVVVEFPSKQAIKDWYNDPGYRPLVAKRHAAARSIMIAVEGQ